MEFVLLIVAVGVIASIHWAHRAHRRREDVREPATMRANDLRLALQRGELPAPVDVPFALDLDEKCRGMTNAEIEQWLPGDDGYLHKSGGFAVGLTWIAARGVSNSVGNAARRARALRNAAEQWREVGRYRVYVTDDRLILEGGPAREWHEIPLREIRRLETIGRSIEFQCPGDTPTRLYVRDPDYWYPLLRRLVLDELPR